jgi:serine/threonine protein phosphatase PrpC
MKDRKHRCPSCGTAHLPEDQFCESCGARIASSGRDRRDHTEVNLGVVAGVTDRGRVHDRNEDALFVSATGDGAVAVVCDGVSMSSRPQHASQLAADVAGGALADALRTRDAGAGEWDPAAVVVTAVRAAQEAVAGIDLNSPSALPPACTLVSALWDGDRVTVGWIGDSRAYWLGDESGARITVDDSWAQERLDAGDMTARTAHADPRAHQLTRWLGADAPDGAPGIRTFVPASDGHVVVCSDGFWNYAPNVDQLAALATGSAGDETALGVARSLTRAAIAAGGHDNVTVAVVAIEGGETR